MIPSTGNDSIEGLLQSAFDKTDSREYTGALDLLKNAVALEPQNIYLSALRRQLETMLELEHNEELSEDVRHELIQPMPGLIDCALRESQRMTHPHASAPPVREASPAPIIPKSEKAPQESSESGRAPSDGAAQKELEALKLLYFQRASKLVMQGNYEQALAEVQRVFTVDPGNTIAKEYAQRVEHLIAQARQLAADPSHARSTSSRIVTGIGGLSQPSAHDSRRATAWTEGFGTSSASAPSPSQRRTSSVSQRMPGSTAPSHAAAVPASVAVPAADPRPAAHGSGRMFAIIGAATLLLLAAGAFIFWPKQSSTAQQTSTAPVLTAPVTQNMPSAPAPALQQPQQQAPAAVLPQQSESTPPATALAKASTPSQQPKEKAETAPPKQKPAEQQSTTAAGAPKKESAPATDAAKSPVLAMKPAVAEQAPQSPAFVPVEKEPRVIKLAHPDVPDYVWLTTSEATVVAKVFIAKDGSPADAKIVKSSNVIFDEPVLKAIRKSEFAPGEMSQGPVSAWVTITFRLKKPR